MSNYRLTVKSLTGVILTFTLSEYPAIEEGHVKFVDSKTKLLKSFPVENCEIQEVQ